jgi:hypothetical protein
MNIGSEEDMDSDEDSDVIRYIIGQNRIICPI